MTAIDDVRFWRYVDRADGPLACWEWRGHRNAKGYARFSVSGRRPRQQAAHRLSWELAHGAIPERLLVLHHCDNPPCVNPVHLFLGTASDNARDMIAKGRGWSQRHPDLVLRGDQHPRRLHPERWAHVKGPGWPPQLGERNGQAKLTQEQVRAIRERYRQGGTSYAVLSRAYGVTRQTIGKIVLHQRWGDLDA